MTDSTQAKETEMVQNNRPKTIPAHIQAANLLKRISKDAMALDDIVIMYQSEIDKREELLKSVKSKLAVSLETIKTQAEALKGYEEKKA